VWWAGGRELSVDLCSCPVRDDQLRVLLPHLAGVLIEKIEQAGTGVRMWARVSAEDGTCPSCGSRSRRVHS
jgi:hypothetical protein